MILTQRCSAWTGLGLNLILAVSFVGSLYVCGKGPRDRPDIVRRRIVTVLIVSSLSPFLLLHCGTDYHHDPSLVSWMGFRSELSLWFWIVSPFLSLLLVMALFTGPLVQEYLLHKSLLSWWSNSLSDLVSPSRRLYNLRTLLVGPFAEEWVFRSCMCSLMIGTGWSPLASSLIPPTLFGISHLHHIVDLVHSHGMPVLVALLLVLFQMAYTCVFGVFASLVFIRTGNFLSCFLIHAFCNLMGFPDLSWLHDTNRSGRRLIALGYLSGIAGFMASFPLVLNPNLYESVFIKQM